MTKYLHKTILILLCSFSASTFNMQAQVVATNDYGDITICDPRTAIVDILDNDLYPCSYPVIEIVDYSRRSASVSITGDNKLKYEITCSFKDAVTDSVKYSIDCGGTLDTATAYITIDQTALATWINFSNYFDKTCLEENEVITHTSFIKNNCSSSQELALGLHFNNDGVVTLHKEALITILSGTMEDVEHTNARKMQVINFKLGPNSEIRVTTEYHITEIISGKYETTIAELMGITFDSIASIYVPACEDKKLTITSCDPVPPIDVAIFCASSSPTYSIQQPVLGSATIDPTNGIIRYTPPTTISAGQTDHFQYEAICGGNSRIGNINIDLLPCMSDPSVSSTDNSLCRQDSCEYNGSNPVLINEVMIAPEKYNGAIYGRMCDPSKGDVGGEWIELYNLNYCEAVDISGYILGNASTDDSGTACSRQRGLGAGFVLPQGTRIPPMGFCVVRSENATPVDPSRLVANGGNTVEIIIDNIYLKNNEGTRFWLPDDGGWLGLYDKDGTPLDAIYWGSGGDDICTDCSPGVISGVSLSSLDGFPASRKTYVLNFKIDPLIHAENSVKRIPDGYGWTTNTLSDPTIGYCNGTCNARFPMNTCNGTAKVTATGGSGDYSYLWDNGQTTDEATGLCEGFHCVTITDNVTHLEKSVCVEVQDDPRCHKLDLKPVTETHESCIITTISINVFKGTSLFISPDGPQLTIVSGPDLPDAYASIDNNGILSYTFPEGSANFTDQVSYVVSINGMTRQSTAYISYKRNAPQITDLKIWSMGGRVDFDIKDGTSPFVNMLDNEPSTATSAKKFRKVPEGWHTLLVTDKNFCTADTTFYMPDECPIIPDIFFTPDGNGIGDGWTIKGLECYEFYTLCIYDRSQRLLKKYVNNFKSWDGTYLGKSLPSTDYWFVLDLEDIEGSITGHFTLIRK